MEKKRLLDNKVLIFIYRRVVNLVNGINTYNESPLHSAIKAYVAQPGDLFEVDVDGYIIDVKRSEMLIEVQTRSFTKIRAKLRKLTQNYAVWLIYPIALERWIVKPVNPERPGSKPTRRKSPKRGKPLDIFSELVSFPTLVNQSNFSIEVLYTREEEIRRWAGKNAWRRKGWAIDYRNLLEVVESQLFTSAIDFRALLPDSLPGTFTVSDLVEASKCPLRLAQQAVYCLKNMGVIDHIGKKGRAYLYQMDAANSGVDQTH